MKEANMGKDVLILNELTPKLQEVMDFFSRIGVRILFSADGKNSYEQILENKPVLAILGVAMQRYSGVEVLRRIKEDDAYRETKIVLVADFENESVRSRAMDAGCDYYVNISQVPQNLYSFVEKIFKEPPRIELRVQGNFDVALATPDKKLRARCINLSRSGILVFCEENIEIGSQISVGMKGAKGEKIIMAGLVARLVDIPLENEVKTGLGIKFTAAEKETVTALENYINHLRGEVILTFKGTKIDLEPLIDLLLSEDAFFAQYLGNMMHSELPVGESPETEESVKESSYKGFNFSFPRLKSWEIRAFAGGTEETEVYLSIIRKMVMLFVKFENCYRVIDDIPFCDPSQEQTLINVIDGCFETGGTTEKEVEHILSSEISMSTVGLSSQIAKTRNKYIISKVKLLKGFVERYEQLMDKKSHLESQIKSFTQILVNMKQDIEEKRQEVSKELSIKKEGAKEQTIPDRERDKTKGKPIGLIVLAASIFIIVVSVFLYKNFVGNRVSVSSFAEPGIISSGKVVEGVLVLESEKSWNPGKDKEITRATLERMYPKMRDNGYKKVKLVDPSGKIMASILAGPLKTFFIKVY